MFVQVLDVTLVVGITVVPSTLKLTAGQSLLQLTPLAVTLTEAALLGSVMVPEAVPFWLINNALPKEAVESDTTGVVYVTDNLAGT
jgi:hypothetical protein